MEEQEPNIRIVVKTICLLVIILFILYFINNYLDGGSPLFNWISSLMLKI